MFEKLKLAIDIAKLNMTAKKIDDAKSQLDVTRESIISEAKELLNTDITKVTDSWIKEKYDEADRVLEIMKKYPSDFTFAELTSIYFDLTKKLEDEIVKRELNIELGLAEKYKDEIFK